MVKSEFLLKKWTFWAPIFKKLGGGHIFMGVPPLMNNTTKTYFGKDLVKICPAIAKQLRHKKKENHRTATKT